MLWKDKQQQERGQGGNTVIHPFLKYAKWKQVKGVGGHWDLQAT